MNAESTDLQIDNLPNRLTIFRVTLIPLVVFSLYFAHPQMNLSLEYQSALGWFAGWVFTAAAITDFFDGYFARKHNIVTVFGSFLDPIADKFLVVSSLIMLLYLERLSALIVIILVLRELYMTSLRLLAHNEGISVPVSSLGKWKTATQMMGIPWLMANETWWIFPLSAMGLVMIYIASALSLLSAFSYSLGVVIKLKELRKIKKQNK